MPSARAKGRVGAGYLKGRRSEITVVRKQWGIKGKVASRILMKTSHFRRFRLERCDLSRIVGARQSNHGFEENPGLGIANFEEKVGCSTIPLGRLRFVENSWYFQHSRC